MAWQQVSEQRYDEMLGVLPPALWLAKGFLVGEPFDHRTCSVRGTIQPSYAAFVTYQGKFFEGPNMTEAEFRSLNPLTIDVNFNPDRP